MERCRDPLSSEKNRVQNNVGKVRKSSILPYVVNMHRITLEENSRNDNIVCEEENPEAKDNIVTDFSFLHFEF